MKYKELTELRIQDWDGKSFSCYCTNNPEAVCDKNKVKCVGYEYGHWKIYVDGELYPFEHVYPILDAEESLDVEESLASEESKKSDPSKQEYQDMDANELRSANYMLQHLLLQEKAENAKLREDLESASKMRDHYWHLLRGE